jgi:hypothetical protein
MTKQEKSRRIKIREMLKDPQKRNKMFSGKKRRRNPEFQ